MKQKFAIKNTIIWKRQSNITELVFIFVQIHVLFQFLLLFGNFLLCHVIDKFINILVFNFILSCIHHILHHLIHDVHFLFFSHEIFHCLSVVFVAHLVVSALHDFRHAFHYIFHRLIDTHLLQFEDHVLKLGIEFVILAEDLVLFEELLSDIFLGSLDNKQKYFGLVFFDHLFELFG